MSERERLPFHAHVLYPGNVLPIVPAQREREWMDQTSQHGAYRCLPLSIANQHGWHVLSNQKLRLSWNGSLHPNGVSIEVLAGGESQCWASTNFENGVVTWTLPYLFRTPPGYNLLARGPANMPKDGISALEGIIETDWAFSTFTMNWKLTRPHHPVEFQIGEPICLLVPQRRRLIEDLEPVVMPLDRDGELGRAYDAWARKRVEFRDTMSKADAGSTPNYQTWQKEYFFGLNADGSPNPEHQTKIELSRFTVDRGLLRDEGDAVPYMTWARAPKERKES